MVPDMEAVWRKRSRCIDDLIDGLMGGDGGGGLDLKKRSSLKITSAEFMKGAALTGGRSKASIMRVVCRILQLYDMLTTSGSVKNRFKGKVTVKFAIDEYGKVIFCQVVESTMGDADLESEIAAKIRRWILKR